MYTNWGARLSFDEKRVGILKEGALANLVVLDQNPLQVAVETINTIKVEDLYLKGNRYKGQSTNAAALLLKSLFSQETC
jgi:predicted amidohydrolase YtcJ